MDEFLTPVDLSELKSISNGDQNFEMELISLFLGQIPVFVSNMNQYFDDGAMDSLAREAHTAKSSVLIFGMTNTGKKLKEIELLAKQKIATPIEPILKEVTAEMNAAKSYLQKMVSEDKN